MASVIGKVAVVTGAGSGFGREICLVFAEHGGRGVVCFDMNGPAAQAVAAELTSARTCTRGAQTTTSSTTTPAPHGGCRAVWMQGDAGSEEDVKAAVDLCVREFGELNVMFANAGVMLPALSLLDEDAELWHNTWRVNVLGVFFAIKHAAIAMREASQRRREKQRGNKEEGGSGSKDVGAIVCTASVAGLAAGAGPAAYSASKAAVINMVRVWV